MKTISKKDKETIDRKRFKKKATSLARGYLSELKKAIRLLSIKGTIELVEEIADAYLNGSQIFILGNGGAASTASHLACDLGKGTLLRAYEDNETRLRVMSLTDNVAMISALANDLSYEDIFTQQLRNLVRPGDLVIVISGSGNSPNVVKAARYGKRSGAKVVGLLGFGKGGKSAKIVDLAIVIQSDNYGVIEDLHLVVCHLVTFCVSNLKKEGLLP